MIKTCKDYGEIAVCSFCMRDYTNEECMYEWYYNKFMSGKDIIDMLNTMPGISTIDRRIIIVAKEYFPKQYKKFQTYLLLK